jgi:hypothetical protein
MKGLAVVLLLLTAPCFGQEELPLDSVVLNWTVPQEYAAGGSLAEPIVLSYNVEVLPPEGGEWITVDSTKETTYRLDKLTPGLWTFRVRVLTNGVAISAPSNVRTKIIPF